jgi:dTDP-4-amino-4,6-dideoxygalactose transaminase
MESVKGEGPQSGGNGEGERGSAKLLPSHLQPLRGCKKSLRGCKKGVRAAGDAGWAGVYSFNGNKIITSSGGGALISRDPEVVRRALKRSQQSREEAVWYEHREVGFNHRMSNIVAAIGLGQLENLERIIVRKRAIFESYRRLLEDAGEIEFMPEAHYGSCTRWLTVLRLREGRAAAAGAPSERVMRIIAALERENIESRPVWKPMHMQPVFQGCRVYGGDVDEAIFAGGVCLPSGTGLCESEIERIAGVVKAALRA